MAAAREDDEILENMIIPDYVLIGHKRPDQEVGRRPPKYPTLIFVNSRSGGQLGRHLLAACRLLLNPIQIFDLHEAQPEKVIYKVFSHLEELSGEGDGFANTVRENLRILVAGGDGTAAWLFGIIGEMKLSHPPPIAAVPLGTGNNLPYSFGWGRKNIATDLNSVRLLLLKVAKAKVMGVDSWLVVMRMSAPAPDHLEALELPHSMHAVRHVSSLDIKHEDVRLTVCGGFWNYFSIGMDAQVAYAFHRRRQEHPEKFRNQLMNQGTYAMLGCAQGWFCASCLHHSSRNINHLGKITVAKDEDDWKELHISPSIRSIVMLNLPSFSGGLNPWGDPSDRKSKKRGLTRPYVDDGLLEIVGFRDGWHGLALLAPNGHGTRLAQAHKVKIELNAGNHTYMRMDGEPWLQPLSTDVSSTIIEITHQGQALTLTTESCIAESSKADINMHQTYQGARKLQESAEH